MISASQVYSPQSPIRRIGRSVEVDRVDVVEDDLGVEALGVLLEALHQLRALHARRRRAGQLSTSVVVISWPPCATPVISTGFRLARAA